MKDNQMKFCKDCKFFDSSKSASPSFAICTHPTSMKPRSVVTGEPTGKHRFYYCSVSRTGYKSTDCGPYAQHFEQIEQIQIVEEVQSSIGYDKKHIPITYEKPSIFKRFTELVSRYIK